MTGDIFVWYGIFMGIWGAVASLVGVRYGQVLARRWQREQFVRENKKQEYRELLRSLALSIAPIIQCEIITDPEQIKAAIAAENAFHEVRESCIFIAEDLNKIQLLDHWNTMLSAFKKNKDREAFMKGYYELSGEIRNSALHIK